MSELQTIVNAEGKIVGTWHESTSNLGGRESKFFHVSADPRESWQNGIFHNSRYGIFHLYFEERKVKLELTSKGLETPKFRKATMKLPVPVQFNVVTNARNKVLKWLSDTRGESVFLGEA